MREYQIGDTNLFAIIINLVVKYIGNGYFTCASAHCKKEALYNDYDPWH